MSHVGSLPLLNLYVEHLMTINVSTKQILLCLSEVVKQFGFSFNHSIMDNLFEKLRQKGIPKTFIADYLAHDNNMNITAILSRIEELNKEWHQFWQGKIVNHCIICKLDLMELQPITNRMSYVMQLECCGLVKC